MNVEFSFTAFDDFPNLPQSKSKQVLAHLTTACKADSLHTVYSSLIKQSALDSFLLSKNIHLGLADRINTFPHRKQILVHLFDNIASDSYLLQDRARNEASFTSDVRGYKPFKTPINASCPVSHTLTTPLDISQLQSLLEKPNLVLLDHEKLFVDNYLFYCSLTRAISSGAMPILVYIPYQLADIEEGVKFVLEICRKIRTILLQNGN